MFAVSKKFIPRSMAFLKILFDFSRSTYRTPSGYLLSEGILSGKYQSGIKTGTRGSYTDGFSESVEKSAEIVKKFMEIADGMDVKPTQLALAWMLKMQDKLKIDIISILNTPPFPVCPCKLLNIVFSDLNICVKTEVMRRDQLDGIDNSKEVKTLIEHAVYLGIKINIILMDRGYLDAGVMNGIDAKGMKYIVPARDNPKVLRLKKKDTNWSERKDLSFLVVNDSIDSGREVARIDKQSDPFVW